MQALGLATDELTESANGVGKRHTNDGFDS